MVDASVGLTIGNSKDNDVKRISDPTIIGDTRIYYVTFASGDTITIEATGGKSIVSIAKTGSLRLVDTFTIIYDDGSTEEFELLNGKHTFNDFGLIMTSYYMPEPEPKIERIDLPFSSGTIDLTDATGVTPYNDRDGLEFVFEVIDKTRENFAIITQNLSMFLHGRYLKLIPDHDSSYYYKVRLSVDPKKTNPRTSTITLKGIADPFKYSLLASNEPWEWNPFSFVNGIIQSTNDIAVNGTGSVTIIAGGVPTSPEFYVSKIETRLAVVYNDVEYEFANGVGTYRFPQVKISNDDTDLQFVGYGRVSVAYRGRYL